MTYFSAYNQCPPDYGQRWTDSIGKTRVVTVGGSESAFLLQKAQFDGDWLGPNTMETLLLCQYLCQCEGPLWNAVRGTGLAYDASVYLLPDRRAITLNLYRCAQLGQAYERTRETVVRTTKQNTGIIFPIPALYSGQRKVGQLSIRGGQTEPGLRACGWSEHRETDNHLCNAGPDSQYSIGLHTVGIC
jgi:hypothetical protein